MRGAAKWLLGVFLAGICVALFGGQAAAEDKSYKYGLIERVRNTYYNNIIDFNDSNDDKTDFMRIRTSVWGQVQVNPQLLAYAKITNEFRPYLIDPKNPDRDFSIHEVFLDNAYVKITGGDDTKVTATIGRQNLIYGEGFIILDASPLEGSRSIYFDAAKISIKSGPTTVDLLGMSALQKDKLNPINDQNQALVNVWEQAYGVYATNTSLIEDHKVEAYVLHKREDSRPELKLNTIGGRVSRKMKDNFAFAAELAFQIGTKGGNDQTSFGGYAHGSYLVQEENKGTVKAGAYYLSGDDPGTSKMEGWNPVFGRWPKWSELYIYSHITEFPAANKAPMVAYWTNTFSPFLQYSTNLPMGDLPTKISFSATAYHLRANQARRLSSGSMSGKVRGNEIQGLFKFVFNKHVTGHLLVDHFWPGNFYASPRSGGTFIRTGLMLKI